MTRLTKKAILAVGFGTTHRAESKATIEAIENMAAERFPEYEVRRAYTSEIVRKILKERDGLLVDNTWEALESLRKDGFQEVILQPLHIICGEEYQEKVLDAAAQYQDAFDKIAVGRPLLTTIGDYRVAIEALKAQLPPRNDQQAVVLMGHGSDHPANASYACLQLMLMDEAPNVFVGTVEGYPAFEDVLPKLKAAGTKKVVLMPFMLVAGEHVHHDLAGDHEASWKTILEKEGYEVQTYLHGLGENPAFREIYLQHIEQAFLD